MGALGALSTGSSYNRRLSYLATEPRTLDIDNGWADEPEDDEDEDGLKDSATDGVGGV